MNRRTLLRTTTLAIPTALLAACAAGSSGAVALNTAKAWGMDLANAISAAAQVYLAQPNAPQAAMVKVVVTDLQASAVALAGLGDVSTARSAVLSIIGAVQQLSPMVAPFLGAAAPWLPVGLAILQAFVAALPMPPNAPATPPAALHAAALRYQHEVNN